MQFTAVPRFGAVFEASNRPICPRNLGNTSHSTLSGNYYANCIAFSGVALPSTAVLIDNGGGRATFRWCPGFDQQGIHNVKFVADDGTRADTVQVTITVRDLFKGDIHAGGDGVVDAQDLAAFADAWGSTETDPNWNSRCNLDQTPVDGKQVIDERDRLELEKCFGKRQ